MQYALIDFIGVLCFIPIMKATGIEGIKKEG